MRAIRALGLSDKVAFVLGLLFTGSGLVTVVSGQIAGLFLVGLGLPTSVLIFREGHRRSEANTEHSLTAGTESASGEARQASDEKFSRAAQAEGTAGTSSRGVIRREWVAFKRYSRRDWANLGVFSLVAGVALTSLVVLALRGDWGILVFILVLGLLVAGYESRKAAGRR